MFRIGISVNKILDLSAGLFSSSFHPTREYHIEVRKGKMIFVIPGQEADKREKL